MVKQWQKKLDKLDNKKYKELPQIVEDVINWNFSFYDLKKLWWFWNLFRIRKWKIRIIFSIENWKGIIEKIDFRWDIYKDI